MLKTFISLGNIVSVTNRATTYPKSVARD